MCEDTVICGILRCCGILSSDEAWHTWTVLTHQLTERLPLSLLGDVTVTRVTGNEISEPTLKMPQCPWVVLSVCFYSAHRSNGFTVCICLSLSGSRPIWNLCISTSTPSSHSRQCMWSLCTSQHGSCLAPGWLVHSQGFGTSSTGKQCICLHIWAWDSERQALVFKSVTIFFPARG